MRRRRREMMLDLAYPCLVVCLAFATLAVLCTILVPTLRDTYQSFGMAIPALTRVILWAGSAGPWPISPASLAVVGACAAWAAAFGALAGFFGPWGEQAMRRLVSWLPGQRRVDRLANLAEYSLLLGMLIDGRVRLGPALRLAADATADRRLKRDSRRLADEIEQGRTLCEAVDRQPKLAREFYEFAERSRHGPSFGERMVAASEMFASRAQVHQSLLSPCLIPLIYAGIVFLLGTTMFALLYPLVLLLNALA
jgi:type IV pilus assembly protein PilC